MSLRRRGGVRDRSALLLGRVRLRLHVVRGLLQRIHVHAGRRLECLWLRRLRLCRVWRRRELFGWNMRGLRGDLHDWLLQRIELHRADGERLRVDGSCVRGLRCAIGSLHERGMRMRCERAMCGGPALLCGPLRV